MKLSPNRCSLTGAWAPAIACVLLLGAGAARAQIQVSNDPNDNVPPSGVTAFCRNVRVETLHEVTLTKGFWMGKYEVTQGQWKMVMGGNPSHFRYAGNNAPVENLDWLSCRAFVATLNDLSKESGVRYRLPTEAEWEYACRAGTQGPIYTGPLTIKGAFSAPELDEIAWYGGNSGVNYPGAFDTRKWRDRQYDHPRSGTHPVGEKKPNAWGLHDMLGNVSEWVYDMYTNLPPDSVTDPVISPYGPDGDIILGALCVIRGGGWYRLASGCRSAYRRPDLAPHGEFAPPTDNYTGFRLVCDSEVTE